MGKRLKVLLSAYACDPYLGSEDGIGWNWVLQIAAQHDVWVATWADNRTNIEKYIAEHPHLPKINWIYYELPAWFPLRRDGKKRERLHYYAWQFGAYRVCRRLHKEIGFDLVHHLTFGQYWTPSYMALLPIPFVWGPVGGGESAPRSFYSTFTRLGRRYEWLRDTARSLFELFPPVWFMARRAKVSLATTHESAQRMKRLGAKNLQILSNVALPDKEAVALSAIPPRTEGPIRFISMGRLLNWKGFQYGLQGFAQFLKANPDAQAEYWIVGDGPELEALQQEAQRLNLGDKVRFLGHLPRAEVLKRISEVDALVHPSLHDSGGWVCLEAMAAGRPVICLDLGGPPLIVGDTGFVIPAATPTSAINGIAHAMAQLYYDPVLTRQKAEAARARVKTNFSWNSRGDMINTIYQTLSENGSPQPVSTLSAYP